MKKLVVIGFVWPEPATTAAGHRMVQLLEAFLGLGWSVTFATTATKTEYSIDLETLGLETAFLQLNHTSFDDFIRDQDPHYVIFDRFMVEEQFGWRVAEQVPRAMRILNTEDLHSLRKTREICHKNDEDFSLRKWKWNAMTQREIASIYRSDLSLVVSTFEMDLLKNELNIPEILLHHLPFMLNETTEDIQKRWPTFKERTDFITYGNGKHTPNIDATIYLKEKIWPKIRQHLPDANLRIFGAYLPKAILNLHNPKEQFYVMGWKKNLDSEVRKARVLLAPLRFGAGIKGKIMDSLKNGTPVVTTKVGAEGMALHFLPHQLVDRMDAEGFVEAAIQLYSNQERWYRTQKKGTFSLNSNYSKKKLLPQLRQKLETIGGNLSGHRECNYVGILLQHQSLAATKYMGKWIEAKNKD